MEKTWEQKKKSTIWAAELSDSVDKSFMELDRPPEAGLRVGGEDKAGVSLNTHGSVMGIHS
jgi:hypothetical protein